MQDFMEHFVNKQIRMAKEKFISDQITSLVDGIVESGELNSVGEKGEVVMMLAQAMANSCHNKLEELKGEEK